MSDARFLQDGFQKRLSHAIEECGEFLAAAGKTQRWGLFSVDPTLEPSERVTNMSWLMSEMSDVEEAMSRLRAAIEEEVTNG